MARQPDHRYDDDELTGLEITGSIADAWRSGQFATVAAVTSAIHQQRSELPRSAVFWLAYHTIYPGGDSTADAAPTRWPLR